MTDTRTCLTCGDPLPEQTGPGRRRVAHEGHCARLHNRERDEARRNDRLRDALARPVSWAVSREDATSHIGEAAGAYLGDAGYGPDEPDNDREWREWRDKVNASLATPFAEERRKTTPRKGSLVLDSPSDPERSWRIRYERDHAVADCFGCPLYDQLAAVANLTPESMIRGWAVMQEDQAYREADGGIARLMARRPE